MLFQSHRKGTSQVRAVLANWAGAIIGLWQFPAIKHPRRVVSGLSFNHPGIVEYNGTFVCHLFRVVLIYPQIDIFTLPLQTHESREIAHYQFTSWPDFGVPRTASAMLKFLMQVRQHQTFAVQALGTHSWTGNSHGPPIIVHCSAGIGRTGNDLWEANMPTLHLCHSPGVSCFCYWQTPYVVDNELLLSSFLFKHKRAKFGMVTRVSQCRSKLCSFLRKKNAPGRSQIWIYTFSVTLFLLSRSEQSWVTLLVHSKLN